MRRGRRSSWTILGPRTATAPGSTASLRTTNRAARPSSRAFLASVNALLRVVTLGCRGRQRALKTVGSGFRGGRNGRNGAATPATVRYKVTLRCHANPVGGGRKKLVGCEHDDSFQCDSVCAAAVTTVPTLSTAGEWTEPTPGRLHDPTCVALAVPWLACSHIKLCLPA